MSDGVVS